MTETMVLSDCGIQHPGTLEITDIGAGSGFEVRVQTPQAVTADIYSQIEQLSRGMLDAANGIRQVFLFVPDYEMRHFGPFDQDSFLR